MKIERSAHRSRTFLPARVLIAELGVSIGCTVRDISEKGARLQVSESIVLPPAFQVHIPKHERTVQVALRWRRGDSVGVRFDAETDRPTSPEQERDAYVRKLEAEVVRLKLLLETIRADPSKIFSLLDRDAA